MQMKNKGATKTREALRGRIREMLRIAVGAPDDEAFDLVLGYLTTALTTLRALEAQRGHALEMPKVAGSPSLSNRRPKVA